VGQRDMFLTWSSSLVGPPAVAGGISGSTIIIVYVPNSFVEVPTVGGCAVSMKC
jgi:hypothetical protein